MAWAMAAVALGFCGIAVLGVLAIKVFVEAQRLARQVTEATQKIGAAAEDLEQAAAGVARSGGDVL
ncbi:hypothetical protein [Streptomyces sp. NPDC059009]|uniref:hypothetical protein n=1 Tax=Streptomyces sp. NPDC059009 TaxID=3346694 RepID=UPI00368BD2B6